MNTKELYKLNNQRDTLFYILLWVLRVPRRPTLAKERFARLFGEMDISIQFSHSVVSDSATLCTAAGQASLSITNSQSLLKLKSIELVMPSNHVISVIPFSSRLQSFPASGSFPMNQLFVSVGQSIVASASASVLPMNIQDWFPLGWTG